MTCPAPRCGARAGPVLAYYYPGQHAARGLAWRDWDLVRGARPWFEGHLQPAEPCWGYLDDSLPATFLQQVAAARQAGLGGFLVASWWRPDGETCFEETLRGAVLPALPEVAPGFSFGIVWVPVWPRDNLPARMDEPELAEPERYFSFGARDLLAMLDHYLDPFLTHPAYLRVQARPYLGFFHAWRLVTELGREGARRALNGLRGRARTAGLPGLFLVGLMNHPAELPLLRGLGWDALSSYVWWPEWRGPWIQDYLELGQRRMAQWAEVQARLDVPFLPSVATGWDATPRAGPGWDLRTPRFPWSPVVVGNHPDAVAGMLGEALRFMERQGADPHLPVMLATWNEWSEGHRLEPCRHWGDAHLCAISRVLGVSW